MIWFIGGPPRVGKSVIAQAVAGKRGVGSVATDSLGAALEAVLSPDSDPGIFVVSRFNEMPEADQIRLMAESPERRIEYQIEESKAVWQPVVPFVRREQQEGRSLVVEGVAVLPELVARLGGANSRSVFLGNQGLSHNESIKRAAIEREHLGGICLNWGCIPTKALLRTSEIYHLMRNAGEFGLTVSEVGFDFAKVIERSRTVAGRLSGGVAYLMKKHKIDVVDGMGRLDGPGEVSVLSKDGGQLATVKAKHIILATGARARALPDLEPDGKLIWTYKEAMVPDIMPSTVLVVGSGAIGIR